MANASASTTEVDFDDIEDGGGGGSRTHVPEGDYKAKIKSVAFKTSQSGNPMFVWEIVGVDSKLNGKGLTEYTALTKKALWKLRDLMEATVGKAPGGKVNIRKLLDYCRKNVVGKEVVVTLEDDEYVNEKGKTFVSSKIKDYTSIKDYDSDADDVEDEDDADVEEDDNDLSDMSRVELKNHIKDNSLDITVKKSMTDDDIRVAISDLTEDDEEEETEEDEDEEDSLGALDRAGLKALIKKNSLGVVVKKSMSDDDIREAMRSASSDDDEEEIEDVDLDEL